MEVPFGLPEAPTGRGCLLEAGLRPGRAECAGAEAQRPRPSARVSANLGAGVAAEA